MNLLIKFPTRGRPQKFLETVGLYSTMLSGSHNVIILVVIDRDDETMYTPGVIDKLVKIPHVVVQAGDHSTKVEAINDPVVMDRLDWDVVLLASDDMIPQVDGYDDIICSRMEKAFPAFDGVLWFNDGYAEDRLNTLCIIGRRYYDNFGYIYHPDYKSLWCDNEFMDILKVNGRYKYFPDCIIKHEHWANNKFIQKDQRAIETEAYYGEDKATYEQRKAACFDHKVLSILICSVLDRNELFTAMMKNLHRQIEEGGFSRAVEVLVEIDDGSITIGEKRNRLMARATGDYVAFVDDDDYVTKDYIPKILAALRTGQPDCVGIWGKVYMDTKPDRSYKPFQHSIKYREQRENSEFFERPPNHLNPIRRDIAIQFPFPLKDHGEDTKYAEDICAAGVLKTEVMVDDPIYIYIPSWMRKRGIISGTECPSGF